MRSNLRFSAALLPLVVLACTAPAEEAPRAEATASSSSAVSTGALANLACNIATTAAGLPGACSVLSGAETILGFITGLGGSSSSNAQILSQLTTLNQEMVTVDNDIKTMWTAFNNAAYDIEQTQQLQIQDQIGEYESNAKDASARLATWVATGQTDAALIASIDAESSQAAMDLTTSSLYYRAASQANQPNVFDMRQALLSYLYALSVRLAVIQAEDPNYRCVNDVSGFGCTMPYNTELQTHLNFLNSLPGLNTSNVIYTNQIQSAPNEYSMCSSAQDTNSGYISYSDNQGNPATGFGGPADCVGPLGFNATQASTGEQYLQFWDKWNVQQEMGVIAVQKMAQVIQTNMTPDYTVTKLCLVGHPCAAAYNPVGPLVSSTGLCLTQNHSTYNITGLFMEKCSGGAQYQTWQTPTVGATGSLGLSDQSACLDVDLWWDVNGTMPEFCPCSGSPGESYTLTSANELRWSRDTSLCLTAGAAVDGEPELETCDGAANQQWSRTWPVTLIPIQHPVAGL